MSDSPAPPPSEQSTPRSWIVAVAIAWLVFFGVVFFQLDLPNSGVPPVNRTRIWLELPVLFQNCIVQDLNLPVTSWSNLSQRLPIIAAAAYIMLGALSLGHVLLRLIGLHRSCDRLMRNVFAYGLGLSVTSLTVLGIGLAAQRPDFYMHGPLRLLPAACLVLQGVCLLIDRFHSSTSSSSDSSNSTSDRRRNPEQMNWVDVFVRGQIPFDVLARMLVGVTIALFLLAMVLGAMLPSTDFDVKEYHLQGPKEHFQNGHISLLAHNVYTSFPFLTEMLSLLGMIVTGEWFAGALTGKLVLMSFAPATAAAVFAIARRFFDSRVAWAALLVHLSTPWTYRISIIAYAEGGLTFYLFATLAALLITLGSTGKPFRKRDILLTGLLAGSAMACKYPGVLSVVMPLGIVLLWSVWRTNVETLTSSQRIRRVLAVGIVYSVGVLTAVGPWLIKNAVETGNPVYPLLNSVFDGSDWTQTLEANWKAAHGPPHHKPADLAEKCFDVTFKSDWLSPLMFALAPLTLLVAKQRRLIGSLWLYVAFLFLSWWVLTHRIDRFWIPLIPIVSLLAGIGVWWSSAKVWRYAAGFSVAACVIFNLGFITTTNCGMNLWLGDYDDVRPVAVEVTAEPIFYLNQMNLKDADKVLCVGEAQVFDATFPLVYNTVFDISIFEDWCSAAQPGIKPSEQPLKPAVEIRKKLKDEGITHILVNWQEVLRYRMTYGYTEFVSPDRFDRLVELGVVSAAEPCGSLRSLESFRPHELQELRRWSPQLISSYRGHDVFTTAQVYRVLD